MLYQQTNGPSCRQPLLKTIERQALFTGHCLMTQSSQSLKASEKDRFDIVYRYYNDTDTLSIYFAKAVPGLIETTEDVGPSLMVDYASDEKIVSIDMFSASKFAACHFWDCAEPVDNKPPLSLGWDYNDADDSLVVHLYAGAQPHDHAKTDDEDFILGVTTSNLWATLFFSNAKCRVCHP